MFRLARVALVVSDPPLMMVVLTVPPVRFAVPLTTVMQPSDIFELSDPPVIFVWPVTFPPLSCVVPLDVSVVNEPPVRFNWPLEVVEMTVPAVILAVAFAPRLRLLRLTEEMKFPPSMTELPFRVPPERLAVPFETERPLSVPPV